MQIQRVSYSIVKEKRFSLGFLQKYYFFWVPAEILLSRVIAPRSLVQGLQGLCRNINFWRNIHLCPRHSPTPLLKCDVQQLRHSPVSMEWLSMCFDSLKQSNIENKKILMYTALVMHNLMLNIELQLIVCFDSLKQSNIENKKNIVVHCTCII